MSSVRRIAFLCSGNGGNLKFIHHAIQHGFLPDHVLSGVVADRPCGALNYSRLMGLPAFRVEYSQKENHFLKTRLHEISPDMIVTNIHKILDAEVVHLYAGRLMNIHYSLLPAFKSMMGEEPVKKALEMNCRFVGATVHEVSEDVDGGRIIGQAAVPVTEKADFDSIMNGVFRAGCLLLLNAFCRMTPLTTGAKIIDCVNGSYFNPPLIFDPRAFTEDFWVGLR